MADKHCGQDAKRKSAGGHLARRPLPFAAVSLLFSLLVSGFAHSSQSKDLCVMDDFLRTVCLEEPAQRIISLSPGLTELLFSIEAGERVVGTVSYSDYPEAAETIPRVGSFNRIDLEAILAKEPDMVVAWISGNPMNQVQRLEELGIPVYYAEQRDFEDVAHTLERLGRLSGQDRVAAREADEFRDAIEAVRSRHADAEPVRLFYQIWDDPLMTVSADHIISQAGALCGGENIFSDLTRLAPRVDLESVLDRDPEGIVASGMGEEDDSWLEDWKAYDSLTAVSRGNLFFVPPSSLQRPTPRVLEGIDMLCRKLEEARERR